MQDPISSREHFHLRIVDLKIEDVAFGGKGVGRENGKAVFVPFTIDGSTSSAVRSHSTNSNKHLRSCAHARRATAITLCAPNPALAFSLKRTMQLQMHCEI